MKKSDSKEMPERVWIHQDASLVPRRDWTYAFKGKPEGITSHEYIEFIRADLAKPMVREKKKGEKLA